MADSDTSFWNQTFPQLLNTALGFTKIFVGNNSSSVQSQAKLVESQVKSESDGSENITTIVVIGLVAVIVLILVFSE